MSNAASASMVSDIGASANNADPGSAAREVFRSSDFWWKRIEPSPKVSTSWVRSFFEDVFEALARALSSFAKWLGKLLEGLFSISSIGGASGGTLWVWLLVVAIVALVLWKLYPVLVAWLSGRRSRVAAVGEGGVWQTLPEATDLFDRAGLAFQSRHYDEVVRLALLAVIARLETRGLLRYDHTRTNREYQVELRQQADVHAPFSELARIYERVWYGRSAAGPAEAEQAIRVSRSVIHGKDHATEPS